MFHSNSKITKKLARKMFHIYLVLFAFILIVSLAFLLPYFYISSKQKASALAGLLQNNYSDLQSNMEDKLYMLTCLNNLSVLLQNYKREPSVYNTAKINIYLNNFKASNDKTLFLMVEDADGNLFSSLNYSLSGISDFIRENSYYQSLFSQTSFYYSPVYSGYFKNEVSNTNYSFTFLSKRYTINSMPYLVTICYNTENYIKSSASVTENSIDGFTVLNKNRQCVYTNGSFPESSCNDSLTDKMISAKGIIKEPEGYYFYSKVIATNSLVVCYASNLTLLHSFITLFLAIISLCIAQPVLYYLFLIPTNGKYLAPLKQLSDEMKRFSIGQTPPDKITTDDEIEDLSSVFHHMILEINIQAQDISVQEHEKAVTYYKLLTTQLDPHFIYNTMNIINILARQQRTEDIIEVNTALTRILRERLNTQSTTFETVEEEIKTLRQYGIIMDYRYKNNVNLYYEIDPGINNKKIPKNILQPLVENSFYHGLTRDDGLIRGNITVMIYPIDSRIVMEISDDGKGIAPEQLKNLRENKFDINRSNKENSHIGMKNIYNRLSYLYHDNFEMEVQSSPGFGTTVILTLPVVED